MSTVEKLEKKRFQASVQFIKQRDWCWFRFLIGWEGGANVLHLSHPLVLQN